MFATKILKELESVAVCGRKRRHWCYKIANLESTRICDQVRIAPFTRLPRHCRHCQLTTTLGCTFMNTPTFRGMWCQTWNRVARIRDQTDYVPRELDSCKSVPNYYNRLRLKVSERCPCLDMKSFSGGRNKYAFGKINIYILSNTVQMENHKHCDPLSSLVTYFVSKVNEKLLKLNTQ